MQDRLFNWVPLALDHFLVDFQVEHVDSRGLLQRIPQLLKVGVFHHALAERELSLRLHFLFLERAHVQVDIAGLREFLNWKLDVGLKFSALDLRIFGSCRDHIFDSLFQLLEFLLL